MAVKTKIDVRDEIVSHIEEIERNLHWVGKKANIPYGTMYSTFVQKVMDLSQKNLDKINTVLSTDFTLNG